MCRTAFLSNFVSLQWPLASFGLASSALDLEVHASAALMVAGTKAAGASVVRYLAQADQYFGSAGGRTRVEAAA